MAEFCDSAEALAQEFCAVHAGPRNAVEKNPLEVTSTIGEILKRSTPSAVRARIRDPSRMKTEKLWQFVKHFEDGRHGKRPKQNMRETECQPVD
jgi:hypothetical protein